MTFYIKHGDSFHPVKEIKTIELVTDEPEEEIDHLSGLSDFEFSGTFTMSEEALQALIKAGMFSPLYRIAMRKPS